jgi:steroid delta-isomerase-like uncharacterized protein
LVEAWNARDLPRFLAFLSDDVVWDDPAMQAPAVGREAVRRFSETVLRAFPDFHYRIRQPVCVAANGSRCAVPWTITATSLGWLEPPGFGPTGRRVQFDGVDLLELRDGRVSRILTLFNVLPVAGQLLSFHLPPPAGSWSERLLVWAQRLRAWWIRRGSRASSNAVAQRGNTQLAPQPALPGASPFHLRRR